MSDEEVEAARVERMAEYGREIEAREHAKWDRLLKPLHDDMERFDEEMSKSSRPALQPDQNGNDNFERILDDNPWLK